MTDVCPTHRIRSDWRRHRRGLNIIDPPLGDDFALGGIAAQALPLDARIVILSTEPLDADRVALNAAAAKWLGETAPTESTVPVFGWGHSTSATSTALVHGSWSNDDREWDSTSRFDAMVASKRASPELRGVVDRDGVFSRFATSSQLCGRLPIFKSRRPPSGRSTDPGKFRSRCETPQGQHLVTLPKDGPPSATSATTAPGAVSRTCSIDGPWTRLSHRLWPSAQAIESRTRLERPTSVTSLIAVVTKDSLIHAPSDDEQGRSPK